MPSLIIQCHVVIATKPRQLFPITTGLFDEIKGSMSGSISTGCGTCGVVVVVVVGGGGGNDGDDNE